MIARDSTIISSSPGTIAVLASADWLHASTKRHPTNHTKCRFDLRITAFLTGLRYKRVRGAGGNLLRAAASEARLMPALGGESALEERSLISATSITHLRNGLSSRGAFVRVVR